MACWWQPWYKWPLNGTIWAQRNFSAVQQHPRPRVRRVVSLAKHASGLTLHGIWENNSWASLCCTFRAEHDRNAAYCTYPAAALLHDKATSPVQHGSDDRQPISTGSQQIP